MTNETCVVVFDRLRSISCNFRCYIKASKISVWFSLYWRNICRTFGPSSLDFVRFSVLYRLRHQSYPWQVFLRRCREGRFPREMKLKTSMQWKHSLNKLPIVNLHCYVDHSSLWFFFNGKFFNVVSLDYYSFPPPGNCCVKVWFLHKDSKPSQSSPQNTSSPSCWFLTHV